MRRQGYLLLGALALSACQGEEVASICAAFGTPEALLTVVSHGADGAFLRLVSDADGAETSVMRVVLETPLLPEIWRNAEHTMRALPETDPTPCGLADLSTVIVTYADGTSDRRETSCEGNALARLVSQIQGLATEDLPGSDQREIVLDRALTDAAEICADVSAGRL